MIQEESIENPFTKEDKAMVPTASLENTFVTSTKNLWLYNRLSVSQERVQGTG